MEHPVTPILEFTAYGQPAPQGSKRAFAVRGKGGIPTGRIAVIESSHDRVKSWRQAVIDAALSAVDTRALAAELPLTGPLQFGVTFVLPRPKSHYRTGRNAHLLRDSAPVWPAGKPDCSKLLRSTEDALTDAGIWQDDAQIVNYTSLAKVFGSAGIPAGALISIGRMR